MKNTMSAKLSILMAALSLGALAACSREDQASARQEMDNTVATVKESAAEARDKAKDEMADLKEKTNEQMAAASDKTSELGDKAKDMYENAKSSTGDAADKIAISAKDAAITAAINAKLAQDSKLSALKIDVDTQSGHVALIGSAPDSGSRDRASQLARSVDGVVAVDNRLEVRG
jgi:hyperosmotically inducible periplasmic protein